MNRTPRGLTSVPAALAAAVALAVLGAACSVTADEDPVDHAAALTAELTTGGEDGDIVDCIVAIGARELERGPLDPVALDELRRGCQAADEVLDPAVEVEPPPILSLLAEPWTLGDDRHLDELWTACEAGSGLACDDLFDEAPIGSDYEDFGVTCGRRPDVLHCSELDTPEEGTEADA